MFSIHLLLNLLILVRVDVGWSPSQDSLGEKQWNIVEREATPILTQTVTPTFTPSSSSEFPIHLTHIYAPRGKPTWIQWQHANSTEKRNQLASTGIKPRKFAFAVSQQCWCALILKKLQIIIVMVNQCQHSNVLILYTVYDLEQSNTCQSKPNLFLISLIRTYVIWCTLAVMRVVLK